MSFKITSTELRSKYLEFFAGRSHAVLPSASLVSEHDRSVLFTTAGMHPLVRYLLGEPHDAGSRLVSTQKCVRTGDIEEIGDDTHLTFFEMLGNWSLGDYFREEAIRWSFEFLTDPKWLGLPVERLGVTCFSGNDSIPRDLESANLWSSLGIASSRVSFLGMDDNWWGPIGDEGPCGPDTEIFFWMDSTTPPRQFDTRDSRWVEIWNNVFMSYFRTSSGGLEPLERPNVDTGMGLERTLAALNESSSVYDVDTLCPIRDALLPLCEHSGNDHERGLRIIVDHLRACCMLIADGVEPSNKERGYVLRRLLRRASFFAGQLGLPRGWFSVGVEAVCSTLGDQFPELNHSQSCAIFSEEFERFEASLSRGLRAFHKLTRVDAQTAFDLFQTFGFPIELTRELALSRGIRLDSRSLETEFRRHQAQSRVLGRARNIR